MWARAIEVINLQLILLPMASTSVSSSSQKPRATSDGCPKRWIVERDFAWSARFRRLARDYERLPTVLAGLHFVVFTCLMLAQLLHFIPSP